MALKRQLVHAETPFLRTQDLAQALQGVRGLHTFAFWLLSENLHISKKKKKKVIKYSCYFKGPEKKYLSRVNCLWLWIKECGIYIRRINNSTGLLRPSLPSSHIMTITLQSLTTPTIPTIHTHTCSHTLHSYSYFLVQQTWAGQLLYQTTLKIASKSSFIFFPWNPLTWLYEVPGWREKSLPIWVIGTVLSRTIIQMAPLIESQQ